MLQNSYLQQVTARFDDIDQTKELVKENVRKYVTLANAEYYLGGIEILLALRFFVEFFSGYNTNFLTKMFLALTWPLSGPFTLFFGTNYSSGIARSEATTLLAMLIWPVVFYFYFVRAKKRAHQEQ